MRWSMVAPVKKRLPWLLLLSAALGMAGCSGSDSFGIGERETAARAESDPVTLRVWGDLGNQIMTEAPFRQLNENFMKLHPDIRIDYKFVQTPESLDFGLRSNELPDIFYVQGNKTTKMSEMARYGYLLPLDDYGFDLRRFTGEAVQYGTVDGKLYSSLPAFVETMVVYYNKDLFAKYDLAPPKTWDEFIELMEEVKSHGITPIAMPGTEYKERSWLSYILMALFSYEKSQGLMNGVPGIRLTDPEFIAGLQAFRDFAEKGYFGSNYATQDRVGWHLSFTKGEAAMLVDGSWNNLLFMNSGVNVGTFYIPDKRGTRIAPISFNNWTTYSISSSTKYPKQAVQYLKYLNSPEAQQLMGDATGMIPVIDDITPLDSIQELMDYDKSVDNFTTVMARISKRGADAPALYRQTVLAELLTSKMSGEEAAERLDEAVDYPD